ncbi:DHH family phosphoesterase [Candidatus Woesearchaeota archaeon]|nr:DHH family phosphoesterase [Candidatus Woesearchaeota archaeon]
MALTKQELALFANKVMSSLNPYYLFDDDPDGLCSFLICNKHKPGAWSVVKDNPKVSKLYAFRALNHDSDVAFILDKPLIDTEFFQTFKRSIVWLDHHPVQNISFRNVTYLNPRISKPSDGRPTTFWVFKAFKTLNTAKKRSSKLNLEWLAMIGCIADYYLPRFVFKLASKPEYKNLMPKRLTIDNFLYNSRLGLLVKLFSFALKPRSRLRKRIIKELSKINTIQELLDEDIAKLSWTNYYRLINIYNEILNKQAFVKGKLLLLVYNSKYSLTGMLSNELSFKHPEKLVVVCRVSKTKYVCSLRSKHFRVDKVLQKALLGVNGSGGGHEFACGANIALNDFEMFLKNLERALKT